MLTMPDSAAGLAQPPGPQDASESGRWDHTRRRRRLLYSMQEMDLRRAIQEHVGSTRAKVWGAPDLSANPYLSLWETVSRMYAESPAIFGMDETAAVVAEAGYWSLMQRGQRDTLALRELGMAIEIIDGKPVYTPLFPDLLEGVAAPGEPSQPVRLTYTRTHPGVGWVRVTWDLENEIYEARKPDGTDVSEEVLGGIFRGKSYPFRDADGAAIMPVVLYHAAETGTLWDAHTGAEIVEGSLLLGVYLTYWGHVVRTCAWAQRYTAGVEIDGAEVDSDNPSTTTREIIPDPATVLQMRASEDGGQPVIGQWAPPVDPDVLIGAIRTYEERLVESAGLRVDVTRQSSDIRSGYSLAVQRDAIREAQRVYEPLFARSDALVLTKTAQLLGLPVEPVRIEYRGLPISPQERRAMVDEVRELRDAGLMTRVEAWMRLHPGATEDDALASIAAMSAETAPDQLNGAQVAAAKDIVIAVGVGELTKAAAEQMLIEFVGIPPEGAAAVIRTMREGMTTE